MTNIESTDRDLPHNHEQENNEVSMYLDCPEFFFTAERTDYSSAEEEAIRKKTWGEYRQLILHNQERLLTVLEKGENFDDLFGVYIALKILLKNENGPSTLKRLVKHWDFDECLKILSDELQTLPIVESNQPYVGGRISKHFIRLISPRIYYSGRRDLFPEQFENLSLEFGRTFVRDYLNHISTLKKQSNEMQKSLDNTIGLEGKGTVFFWSIAQYVYSGLRTLGLNQKEAINTILQWIKAAYQKGKQRDDFYSNNFQGSEELPYFELREIDKPLGFDERCPSHLYYRLIGMKVAKLLSDEKGR